MKKIVIITAFLLSTFNMLSNANELSIGIKNDFVNIKEYIELLGGKAEIKELVINSVDSEVIKKYIFKLQTNTKNKDNVFEIFENGQGIYINGEYIPFESEDVDGFTVPKVEKAITQGNEVNIPKEILERYFGAKIIDDKMIVNKDININVGALGEFNEFNGLVENSYDNSQIEEEIEEEQKNLEQEIKDSKPEVEKPKPEIEKPKPEVEKPKPKPEKPKPEVEKPKPEVEKPKPEIEESKPEVEKPKPDVENPDLEVETPEPEVDNPEPEAELLEPEAEILEF